MPGSRMVEVGAVGVVFLLRALDSIALQITSASVGRQYYNIQR